MEVCCFFYLVTYGFMGVSMGMRTVSNWLCDSLDESDITINSRSENSKLYKKRNSDQEYKDG